MTARVTTTIPFSAGPSLLRFHPRFPGTLLLASSTGRFILSPVQAAAFAPPMQVTGLPLHATHLVPVASKSPRVTAMGGVVEVQSAHRCDMAPFCCREETCVLSNALLCSVESQGRSRIQTASTVYSFSCNYCEVDTPASKCCKLRRNQPHLDSIGPMPQMGIWFL